MQHSTHIDSDVAIVGGGLVGASLALALARAGLRVAVVEQFSADVQTVPQFDGRVSAIAAGSANFLRNLGVWDAIARDAQAIHDIRVSDAQAPVFLHYSAQEVNEESFGFIAENRHIRRALLQACAAEKSIDLIAPGVLKTWEETPHCVALQLASGRTLKVALVIAADGKHSMVREKLGISTVAWDYSHAAIVCTIAHTKPHHGLAQERFLPVGPFAVLPMAGNFSSLVWTEPQARAAMMMQLPEAELAQEITERVGDYLGEISLHGPRYLYPLSLCHAAQYVQGRFVLAGDAAHAMHPIAGQGVNMGFRDAAVLAELLSAAHRLGQDIGTGSHLARYQRWRRFDNVMMMTVTDGLNRLFSTELLPIAAARRAGLWAVGQMPWLKKTLIRHAMGALGDVPELMKKVS